MAESPGKILWESIKRLDVDTGKLEINVIEGWYDTDSTELKEFLDFIGAYVTPQNILSPAEEIEYEELQQRGVVVNGVDYDKALKQLTNDYSGILDVEENEFEIEVLEDKKNIAIDDNLLLRKLIKSKESWNNKLDKKLSELETKKILSTIEKEKAAEECINLAAELDNLNTKLYEQVVKYSEKLDDLDTTEPNHITNMPLYSYNEHFRAILKTFQELKVQEIESLPQLQSAVQDSVKLNDTIFNHEDVLEYLENMKYRVFKSLQNRNLLEAKLCKLKAEKKFLENFDVLSVVNITYDMNSVCSSLTRNYYFKREEFSKQIVDLENKACRLSQKCTDLHSLQMTKQELIQIEQKLEYILNVDKKFDSLFSYHCVLYLMCVASSEDVSKTDEFFKVIHRYIIHELERCSSRIQAMEDIIADFKAYQELPVEKRSGLLRAILSILTNNNPDVISLKSAVKLLADFHKECEAIEKQLFVDEPNNFRQEAVQVELDNRSLKKFLTNGPTSEYITMHYDLCKIFHELDETFKAENSDVHNRVAILNNATKKVSSNEWLKYKRLLWMYFLLEPKKVTSIIDKIEKEVQQRIRDQLEDRTK